MKMKISLIIHYDNYHLQTDKNIRKEVIDSNKLSIGSFLKIILTQMSDDMIKNFLEFTHQPSGKDEAKDDDK